ncbi:Nucleoporin GLE1 [Smittium culicis]|uniref:mRNA export factor GLE1 n=1 Tax=Smittium culicis TaxID=133412 RepID=A0A1R1YQ20_9FUNG|nr:Nucleoporin GLE1 [Smittium culicis]
MSSTFTNISKGYGLSFNSLPDSDNSDDDSTTSPSTLNTRSNDASIISKIQAPSTLDVLSIKDIQNQVVEKMKQNQIENIKRDIYVEIVARKKNYSSSIKEAEQAANMFKSLSISNALNRVNEIRSEYNLKVQKAKVEKDRANKEKELKEKQIRDKLSAQLAQEKAKLEAAELKSNDNHQQKPPPKITTPQTLPTPLQSQPNITKPENKVNINDRLSNELFTKLTNINTVLAPKIKQNPDTRKFCFESKRGINLRIGQLTNTINQINLVSQAETEVAVKVSVCFPLASVTVLLLQSHPPLLEMVLIRLNKKCPYILPRTIRKSSEESKISFVKKLCFKVSENNEIESMFKYEERMCGMLAFYFAIFQSVPKTLESLSLRILIFAWPFLFINFFFHFIALRVKAGVNPYPIHNGWKWISKLLNLPVEPIYPALITTFIEIAGFTMETAYGPQFTKLLMFIKSKYIPHIPKTNSTAIAATARLESCLAYYFDNESKFELVGDRIAK